MAPPHFVQNQRTPCQFTVTSTDFDLSAATSCNLVVTSALRSETWVATITSQTTTTLVVRYYPLDVAIGGLLNPDEVLTIRIEPVGPYGAGGASCSIKGAPPVVASVYAERGPL
jgi:hypothetical protein